MAAVTALPCFQAEAPQPRCGRFGRAVATALWLLGTLLLTPPAAADTTTQRWAHVTETTFQHLTLDQGLPNEIATAVAEDGDGFIWLGTLGGLARWDGYRLRVYKSDPRTPGALPDNVIQTLHGDSAGRLWIGTSAAGLVRYDRANDRFVTLGAGPQGLSHVSVRGVVDDGAGGLWVATDGGLDHLDAASGSVYRRDADAGAAALQGRRVLSLLRDRHGALWVGTDIGLLRRSPDGARFEPVPLLAAGVQQPEAQNLMQDSVGRIWAGTVHHGAFVIGIDGMARPVLERAGVGGVGHVGNVALGLQQINDIVEAQPGEVWVGTVGQGVVVVDAASGQTRRIRHQPTLPLSLADNSVRGLHRDRSGLVWVATNRGVSRHDPRQSAILTMFGSIGGSGSIGGLAGTEISWILPAEGGRIWLATHNAGVEIIDGSGTRVAQLRPDPARPTTALPQDIVLALERVADGSVFIGTKRGLYRAAADGSRVERVALGRRDPNASTWALLADGGTLWVGGQADGLWKLDIASGRAEPVTPEPALTDQRIIVLAHGAGGTLWVGTRYGLNQVDRHGNVLTRIVPAPQGLSAGFIDTLYTDRQGRLWVGTYGGGINILESAAGETPRFRHLATAQGLPDDNVNALIEDAQGQVWASTDNGLAVIDPKTLAVRALRRAEGVVFATYWTGAAARTPEGELLFGGAGGLSIVRPERLQPWTYRPPVVVSELRVAGKSLPAGRHFGAGELPPVQVPADGNSLSVEFAAIDYSAPERNRYAYRLLGFDSDWVETDASRRLALYNNLPPGNYTLRLRGSNRDGTWTDEPTALPVLVLAAWHQTLWFRSAAVLAVLLLLAVVVRWRTRLLRARQVELERKVSERTAELHKVSVALQEKSRVLELSSVTDPLTGLYNRRFLTTHIDTEIAASLRRAAEPATVTKAASGPAAVDTDNVFLLIDVDHFKRVNDLHGHAAGDEVLVQLGQRLRGLMRETDFLVRWGGEEFLAVARNTDRSRAEELAERIREVVAQVPFTLEEGRTLAVTCSIGFASMPFVREQPRALGWQDVVKLADIALLTSKRAGRNAWVGLQAATAVRTDGLLGRVQAAPQQALRAQEISITSSRALALVAEALPATEGQHGHAELR